MLKWRGSWSEWRFEVYAQENREQLYVYGNRLSMQLLNNYMWSRAEWAGSQVAGAPSFSFLR